MIGLLLEVGANDPGRGVYQWDCIYSCVEQGAYPGDDPQVHHWIKGRAGIARTTRAVQSRSLSRAAGEDQGRCMSGSTTPNSDLDPLEPRDATL